MQQLWSAEELVEHWSLSPGDLALLPGKVDGGKLGFAVQLAFYKRHARFPDDEADVAPAVIAHIAGQIGVAPTMLDGYDWTGRSGRRHRQQILDFLAVTPFDKAAETAFRAWLANEVLPHEPNSVALEEQVSAWFARNRISRPGDYRLDRLLASVRAAHDEQAFRMVAARLDAETRHRLDALLADDGMGATFSRLQSDPGRVGLESLLTEIEKLEMVRALKLPADVLKQHHSELIKRFRRRVATEAAWELRRHPDQIRLPLLVFYCVPREAEIADGLIELLMEITHRITVRAERRAVEELLEEYRQVRGKAGILFRVAEAAVDNPDGIVREVIFPVASEQTFAALVKEYRASGAPHNRRIYTAIRASYGSYYRRMLPKLLAALEFRSNNANVSAIVGCHRCDPTQ
jgi:Domain of unknown function (DUF4158)